MIITAINHVLRQACQARPTKRRRYRHVLHQSRIEVLNSSAPDGTAGTNRVAFKRHEALAVIH